MNSIDFYSKQEALDINVYKKIEISEGAKKPYKSKIIELFKNFEGLHNLLQSKIKSQPTISRGIVYKCLQCHGCSSCGGCGTGCGACGNGCSGCSSCSSCG